MIVAIDWLRRRTFAWFRVFDAWKRPFWSAHWYDLKLRHRMARRIAKGSVRRYLRARWRLRTMYVTTP